MMKVTTLKSIDPGNPFLSDLYHMGTKLGSNVIVMYEKHISEKQYYVIVINTETGERVRIDL